MKYYLTGIPLTYTNDETWIIEEIFYKNQSIILSSFNGPTFITSTRVINISPSKLKLKELKERYYTMQEKDTFNVVKLISEINDDYSDDSLFNISSWGADLSFRELISMYEENELLKPELQRKYVWDKNEASRFIESILLGLPVPSIFLAQSGTQKLIIDGYQRIMTVYDYVSGVFSADGKLFRLSNSEKINKRWRNKAFAELSTDEQRKIRSTTIHAIIFEQKKPENDDTSLFQVFERINTSGRTLTPQEIRNCVYQGSLNSLLFELNKYPKWRTLFGSEIEDNRMRDIEYILRFFVMISPEIRNNTSHQISLKKSLNDYMGRHKDADVTMIDSLRVSFIQTIDKISEIWDKVAFRNYNNDKFSTKFHPAIYDAVMVGFYDILQQNLSIVHTDETVHIQLLCNDEFKNATSKRTTDLENIRLRIKLVKDTLLGES